VGQPTTTFETIPGIGPNMARDLRDLGFTEASELRGQDPERMFEDLCQLRGQRVDRCVLYAFRCAVYFVSHERHDAELLKWWNWKDRDARPDGGREPEV
jgi:hypothetical protein